MPERRSPELLDVLVAGTDRDLPADALGEGLDLALVAVVSDCPDPDVSDGGGATAGGRSVAMVERRRAENRFAV